MYSSATRTLASPHTGLISVTGRDAESFLHAQLTRHIQGLAPGLAPLAGWCDARGRLRALFRILRTDEGFVLLTDADSVAASLKGLQLFVLRADVTLADWCASWRTVTIAGPELTADLAPGAQPGAVNAHDEVYAIRLGAALVQVTGPAAAIERWLDKAGLPAPVVDDMAAVLAEIRLGLPALPAALAGRFLPQMLNLDRLDAVSFDKGCFPGQEVIARTHNLGQVKRRMTLFSARPEQLPVAGTEVLDDTGHTVGEVVRAACATDHVELLAVVPVNAGAGLWLAPSGLAGQPDVPARIALQPEKTHSDV